MQVGCRAQATPGIVLPRYCEPTEFEDVRPITEQWIRDYGLRPDQIVVNEAIDSNGLVIQGEVMREIGGLLLHYSTEKLFMRPALKKKAQSVTGMRAQLLLAAHLDTPSYEQLMWLLDTYEDGIVEFSTYAHPVGELGWNTVFWELRNY